MKNDKKIEMSDKLGKKSIEIRITLSNNWLEQVDNTNIFPNTKELIKILKEKGLIK